MQAILLDAQQTSVVTHSDYSIPVHDQAGILVGHIMPTGATHGQRHTEPRGPSNSKLDKDRWIECWNEWYAETDEQDLELPETD